ncbi:MAG TPA: sulfur carrier protein ThiS adenylyltransferase ThiF [Chitinispirillaceae bacterium]|nr:sulfur carrier protein ThiS adenylyltransferase ThiF [Chitinispirillaceae bacterium]
MGIFQDALSPFFEPDQFRRIQAVKIGIAGAGGIGSNCAMILVRCGFGNFTIVDFDRVEPSNLNRQIYTPAHIGRMKVDCLKEVLLTVNASVSTSAVCERVTRENADSVFDDCDVIIEAFDSASSKADLFSVFLHSGKLIVGVSGIGGIGNCTSISILKVAENVYVVGDRESEVNEKVRPYAPRVMVASAMMADVVLGAVVSGDVRNKI